MKAGVHIYLLVAILVSSTPGPVNAQGDPTRGASLYSVCGACHSLEPGIHLTGPSLSGLWGKKVASVAGFPRYSRALQSRDFEWDETTLYAWLAEPSAFVPDNNMTFKGIENDKDREDLMAFLRLALSSENAISDEAKRLLPDFIARGQVMERLDQAGPEQVVVSVRHCRTSNSFYLVTGDGKERLFWETNLRLKVDTSAYGPKGDKPVLVEVGAQGDRAALVFSDLAQIGPFIQSKC